MIEYKLHGKSNIVLRVYSDGVHCGSICSVAGGYQYRPKNSTMRGQIFNTVAEVKKSLESDA